jgi:uncharacterized membrane protein YdbT with pleckstrin-like domain
VDCWSDQEGLRMGKGKEKTKKEKEKTKKEKEKEMEKEMKKETTTKDEGEEEQNNREKKSVQSESRSCLCYTNHPLNLCMRAFVFLSRSAAVFRLSSCSSNISEVLRTLAPMSPDTP